MRRFGSCLLLALSKAHKVPNTPLRIHLRQVRVMATSVDTLTQSIDNGTALPELSSADHKVYDHMAEHMSYFVGHSL